MKFAFYNHYHNGDLFVSREFIRQIKDKFGNSCEYHYYHSNREKTTKDIAVYKGLCTQLCNHSERFFLHEDTLYINTWVGIYHKDNYKNPPYPFTGGINYLNLCKIWEHIFAVINNVFIRDLGNIIFTKDIGLKIHDDPEKYIARIDFSKYDLSIINDFVSNDRKRVLFSNGPVHSGQSFNHDMASIITQFATQYSNIDFICTKRFNTTLPNIIFTDDFNIQDGDIVEIGYLSRFCDVIIGKNSGPFIYCLERENFTDPDKKIIQFNVHEHDSLHYGLKMKSDFTFSNNFEEENMCKIIKSKIEMIA